MSHTCTLRLIEQYLYTAHTLRRRPETVWVAALYQDLALKLMDRYAALHPLGVLRVQFGPEVA